jgi:glycosyltransferase involved in cell wall biosynthesis
VIAPDYLGEPESAGPKEFSVQRYRAGNYSGRWYPAYLRVAHKTAGQDFEQILGADIAFLESLSLIFPKYRKSFSAFVHGSEVARSKVTAKGRILAPLHLFQRPEHIFANSEFTRQLLLKSHSYVPSGKVKVAPLGVNERWFAPTEAVNIRRRLGLTGNRIIACVGRITPRKGQLTLLRALAAPSLDRPTLSVVIAGRSSERDSAYLAEVHAAIGSLQHANAVLAEELSDDEVRALYAEADVFCLPGSARTTAVEGFGLVFLEAAAQGAPSVAGAVGGVPEVVRHGLTGLVVPPDDPESLSEALTSLLDNESLRQQMSASARAAAKEFTWRRCARAIFGEAVGAQQ